MLKTNGMKNNLAKYLKDDCQIDCDQYSYCPFGYTSIGHRYKRYQQTCQVVFVLCTGRDEWVYRVPAISQCSDVLSMSGRL